MTRAPDRMLWTAVAVAVLLVGVYRTSSPMVAL